MTGTQKTHKELIITLGDDAGGFPQIKIQLQKFRKGDSSWKNLPRPGRSPLTFEPQFEMFRQKRPFPGIRIIANYLLATVSTIKTIVQKESGMKQFSGRWAVRFLRPGQEAAPIKASKGMLPISQESEASHLNGIAASDKSYSQCFLCVSRYLHNRQQRSF
jgi:hypothetical protein